MYRDFSTKMSIALDCETQKLTMVLATKYEFFSVYGLFHFVNVLHYYDILFCFISKTKGGTVVFTVNTVSNKPSKIPAQISA